MSYPLIDHHDYRLLDGEQRTEFDAWILTVTGQPIDAAHILSARVVDGVLHCEQLRRDDRGRHYIDPDTDDVAVAINRYPLDTAGPPPVWPSSAFAGR